MTTDRVSAGNDLLLKARELLAVEYERPGYHRSLKLAKAIRNGEYDDNASMRAIIEALRTAEKTEPFPLREFVTLLMCSDPWPVPNRGAQDALVELANREAWKLGYGDWLIAYHRLPAQPDGQPPAVDGGAHVGALQRLRKDFDGDGFDKPYRDALDAAIAALQQPVPPALPEVTKADIAAAMKAQWPLRRGGFSHDDMRYHRNKTRTALESYRARLMGGGR